MRRVRQPSSIESLDATTERQGSADLPLHAADVVYDKSCRNPVCRVRCADRACTLRWFCIGRGVCGPADGRSDREQQQRARQATACCKRTGTVDSHRVGELTLSLCDERFDCLCIFFRNANQLHTFRLVLVHIELVKMRNCDFARRAPGRPELDNRHLAAADFKCFALYLPR